MIESGDIEKKSAATSTVAGVLSESLRCQYLDVMGIQTWFDPSLKVSATKAVPLLDEIVSVAEPNESKQVKSEISPEFNSVIPSITQESTNLINNMEALGVKIAQCELCELHTTRKQAISGEGNVSANLLILIDAPVKDESGENALFDVADKNMLKAMLQTIGIQISSVYLSSLVKCRPSEQRLPQTSEMICCDDHLTAQINLLKPGAILVLGEQASQQLLVSQKSITDLRLRHHQHLDIPVFASYHPRELFGSSETKRKVWADLLQIMKHIN